MSDSYKKGQISVETMVAIAIIIVVFAAFFTIGNMKENETKEKENYLEMKNDCMRVANVINNVYVLGDESSMTVPVHSDLMITSKGDTVFIKRKDAAVYCPLFSTISPGSYTKGKIKISNNNGQIKIENV